MSRARIAHWMLEEVGVPYRLEVLRLDKQVRKTAAFLAMSPMAKLPTIVDNGVIVTEAGAIWIATRERSWPALHDPTRASYLRWLFFGAGCVESALVDHMLARPLAERPGTLGTELQRSPGLWSRPSRPRLTSWATGSALLTST